MVVYTHDRTVDYSLYSVEDKAWAAGFIDGDGMISYFRRVEPHRHDEFYLKVSVVNTHRGSLEKLQLMFGGSITALHTTANRPRWANSWTWATTHRNAERVLRALAPYFVTKHEQTVLALSARELVGDRFRRRDVDTLSRLAEIETQFRALNKKGV